MLLFLKALDSGFLTVYKLYDFTKSKNKIKKLF